MTDVYNPGEPTPVELDRERLLAEVEKLVTNLHCGAALPAPSSEASEITSVQPRTEQELLDLDEAITGLFGEFEPDSDKVLMEHDGMCIQRVGIVDTEAGPLVFQRTVLELNDGLKVSYSALRVSTEVALDILS